MKDTNDLKTNIVVNVDTTLTSRMKDLTGKVFNNHCVAMKTVGRNYANRILWQFKCMHCDRTIIRIGTNITQCVCECQHKKIKNYNISFYDWCKENNHEDWINLWDNNLNKYSIHEIGYSSDEKCWFKCNNDNNSHHSEQYRLSNLTNNCQKGIFCSQCNSFAQEGINLFGSDFLNKYWDYEKNAKDPWEISKGSGQKIWIKCGCGKHQSHETNARDAFRFESSCPYCTSELKVSKLHNKTINYLFELGFNVLQEFNCNIIAINPYTNHYLPYDVEVHELRLIIEIMGEQHYNANALFNKTMATRMKISTEEYFQYRQWIDEYKKEFVLKNGYSYLELSYKSETRDKYKNIILNKIKEIQL